jgi:hypothetical protein
MPRIRTSALWAAALAVVGVLWAGPLYAFCREVTGTPPANYDPAEAGCFQGVDDAGKPLLPLFWRNQCVSYSVQQNASIQVTLADVRRVARQAFDTWSNSLCDGDGGSPSIAADEYSLVSCDQVPSNEHNNPIIFRDTTWPYDSANAIGFTTLTVNLDTGEILGAAIEINSSNHPIVADVDGSIPNGAYDLASILTHEAGHFLGLAHSQETSAVMYAFYHPGSTNLTQDDLGGICQIYPPDMTRNTAAGTIGSTLCNATPPLGFLTTCGSSDAGAFVTGSGPVVLPDGGDPPCTYSDCAMGHGRPRGGAGFTAGGLALLFAVARRRRGLRRAGALGPQERRRRAGGAAIGGAMAVLSLLVAREAAASVSIMVQFEELLQKSTAVAVVTPTEQRGVWEDGRIVSYTHVRIDRRVAGALEGDLWLRSLGGSVGRIGQMVEGQPTFETGKPSLVFLRNHADGNTGAPVGAWTVVEAAQGQYPVVAGEPGKPARVASAKDVGALVPPAGPVREGVRFANEVLEGRSLEDVVRQITGAWGKLHPG